MTNDEIIRLAVELASSKNSENSSLNKHNGENASEYIEEIYNKLCELNEKTNQN